MLPKRLRHLACSLGVLLMAGMQPGEWSTSDKTAVDLEIAPPVAATHHARPRGAQHYRHDETEVDLATPLPVGETPTAAPDPVPADSPEAVTAEEEEATQ